MDTAFPGAGLPAATSQPPIARPAPSGDAAKAAKAAHDYEGVFIAQLLGSMFQGIPTDGMFGGGPGEAMFRSLLVNQYAASMADQGGFGLAAHMKSELLRHQQGAS